MSKVINNNEIIAFEEYEKYMICKFNKIKYPKFIFVYFDIGEKLGISMYNGNCELFPKFIKLNFNINNKEYKLVGIINVPSNNHYSTSSINYNNSINMIELKGNYNYDDMNNPPILPKIKYNISDNIGFIKYLMEKNIYIFNLYGR